MISIAYFITPHGFGHATRAAAVMAALQSEDPSIHPHIFTQAPERIFTESLPGAFTYHDVFTDLGMVQTDPLHADLSETIRRLNTFLPFDDTRVDSLAKQVQSCTCICCDIAPLGIAVAKRANIPSILIENFTWDWIYEPHVQESPGFAPHIDYLHRLFQSADHHIQTTPMCETNPNAITVSPVSRAIRQSRAETRQTLGLPDDARAVMITMGGTPFQYTAPKHFDNFKNTFFLLPNSGNRLYRKDNCIHIPHASPIFHPDLVNTCDAVVAKVGYSTLAEVYHAGAPFGYIPRPGFRESDHIIPFIKHHMPGLSISEQSFTDDAWLDQLPELLAMPRAKRTEPNGADQIAHHLMQTALPVSKSAQASNL